MREQASPCSLTLQRSIRDHRYQIRRRHRPIRVETIFRHIKTERKRGLHIWTVDARLTEGIKAWIPNFLAQK